MHALTIFVRCYICWLVLDMTILYTKLKIQIQVTRSKKYWYQNLEGYHVTMIIILLETNYHLLISTGNDQSFCTEYKVSYGLCDDVLHLV